MMLRNKKTVFLGNLVFKENMINEDLLELQQLSRKTTNNCKTLKPHVFCFRSEYDYLLDTIFKIQLQCQGGLFFTLPISYSEMYKEDNICYIVKDEEKVQRRFLHVPTHIYGTAVALSPSKDTNITLS